jgi:hypothetical protein
MLSPRNWWDDREYRNCVYNTSVLISQRLLRVRLRSSRICHYLLDLAVHILCIVHKARK